LNLFLFSFPSARASGGQVFFGKREESPPPHGAAWALLSFPFPPSRTRPSLLREEWLSLLLLREISHSASPPPIRDQIDRPALGNLQNFPLPPQDHGPPRPSCYGPRVFPPNLILLFTRAFFIPLYPSTISARIFSPLLLTKGTKPCPLPFFSLIWTTP